MVCLKNLRTTALLATTLLGSIPFVQAMDEPVAEEVKCTALLRQQRIDIRNAQLLKEQQSQELSSLKEKLAAESKPFKNRWKQPPK